MEEAEEIKQKAALLNARINELSLELEKSNFEKDVLAREYSALMLSYKKGKLKMGLGWGAAGVGAGMILAGALVDDKPTSVVMYSIGGAVAVTSIVVLTIKF